MAKFITITAIMHGCNILLLASLVVPMLAAPAPIIEISPRHAAPLGRENTLLFENIVNGILGRESPGITKDIHVANDREQRSPSSRFS